MRTLGDEGRFLRTFGDVLRRQVIDIERSGPVGGEIDASLTVEGGSEVEVGCSGDLTAFSALKVL